MKLYTYDPAPNPQRLTYFLAHKGIDIETVQIDMMKNEQLSDEYHVINPAGTIPALVLDDGTILTEVIGICAYLEALYPEQPLLGTTALEKAEVLSWDHKLFNSLMMAVAEALRNGTPAFENRALPGPLDVAQIPELVTRGKLRLTHAWPALNEELADKNWLVGDALTLADIDLLICSGFSKWVKCPPPEDCANIHAHAARTKAALGLK
ncbi:MAG: glutathione S-transferase family protein [Halioglobus sp.]